MSNAKSRCYFIICIYYLMYWTWDMGCLCESSTPFHIHKLVYHTKHKLACEDLFLRSRMFYHEPQFKSLLKSKKQAIFQYIDVVLEYQKPP